MTITVQFEESCDRVTHEEVRGASREAGGPHRRAVPISQPVKANESQQFQKFVQSVKEKKEALEQERLAHQNAERIAREEEKASSAPESDEETEDEEEISPEERVAEVCASKWRHSQAAIDVHHHPRRKRRSLPYSWN